MLIFFTLVLRLFILFINADLTTKFYKYQWRTWEIALNDDNLPIDLQFWQWREWYYFGHAGVSDRYPTIFDLIKMPENDWHYGDIKFYEFQYQQLWCTDEDWLNHLAIPDGMTIDQFVNYDIRLFWLSPLNFYYPDPAYAESQRSVPIWLMEHSFLKRELVFNINEMPLYNDIVAVRELKTGEYRIVPYWDSFDKLILSQKFEPFIAFSNIYNIEHLEDGLFYDSEVLYLDASKNYQIGFQDPASPIAEGLIDLHHHIFLFLIIVIIFVYWMIVQIIIDFNEFNYVLNSNTASSFEIKNSILFNYVKVMHNTHGVLLEVIWTLIPTFILMFIALPSFALLYAMDEVVDPELTLKVVGHQWYWSYEYSDYLDLNISSIDFDSYMLPVSDLMSGDFRLLEVDNLVVLPAETHVRFIITAGDVLHCWAVPSLGIKMDAVPGRLNQQNVFIKREGLFFGQCSELCGVNHGFMPIVIKAVNINEYTQWLLSQNN